MRDEIQPDDILVVCIGGNDIALRPSLKTIFSVLGNVFFGGNLGVAHLQFIFRDRMRDYISRLVEKEKPKLIVVCLFYFPDEANTRSWASCVLAALRYGANPQRLQDAIRRVFEEGIKEVQIEGVRVTHVPFYEVLDGKRTELYVERVEPSEEGGKLMAELVCKKIVEAIGD